MALYSSLRCSSLRMIYISGAKMPSAPVAKHNFSTHSQSATEIVQTIRLCHPECSEGYDAFVILSEAKNIILDLILPIPD
jgi:hypothetical protein